MEEIKMNFKKYLVSALAACELALAPIASAKAADGSIEAMCGDKQCVQDIKASGSLTPTIGIFAREITTVDYTNQVGNFGLADLTHNVVGGLDGVAEIQYIPNLGALPRAGVQYFRSVGDVSVYALATSSLTNPAYGEALVNVSYTPALTPDLRLILRLEDVTDLSSKGHDFSKQRLRAGVTISDKLQLGAAGDIVEIGNSSKPTYNLGGFAGLKF